MAKKIFKNTEGKMLGVFLHDIYQKAVEGFKNQLQLHPIALEEYEEVHTKVISALAKTSTLSIKMSEGTIISDSHYIGFTNKLLTAVLEGKTVSGDAMKFVQSFPTTQDSNVHEFVVEVNEVDVKPVEEAPEKAPEVAPEVAPEKAPKTSPEKTSKEPVPKVKKAKKIVVAASHE